MTTIEKLNLEFISHCRYEKNLSPKTLKAYSIDLTQFVGFLDQNNYSKEITSISKNFIKEYIQSISAAKPKTIKRKIATVKALFNFLEYEDKITVNPFRKMRIQIREPKNLPSVMNIHEVEQIINSTYQAKSEEKRHGSYTYAMKIQKTMNIFVDLNLML
jgi:site-specific recombinase XerD